MHSNAANNDSNKGAQGVKNLIDGRILTREAQIKSEIDREFKARLLRGIENLQAKECSTIGRTSQDLESANEKIQAYQRMVRQTSSDFRYLVDQFDADNENVERSKVFSLEHIDHCTRRIDETSQELSVFSSCIDDQLQAVHAGLPSTLERDLRDTIINRINELKCGVTRELNAVSNILDALITNEDMNDVDDPSVICVERVPEIPLPEARIINDLVSQNAILRKTLDRVRDVGSKPILVKELKRIETVYLGMIEELSGHIWARATSSAKMVDRACLNGVLKVVLDMNDHFSETFIRGLDIYLAIRGSSDKKLARFVHSTATRCSNTGRSRKIHTSSLAEKKKSSLF